ncbi:MAG: ETC complex I subunit [Alphaproteobacteria bacterium]|nr:ETC complex I subunit [Alphaproteobacteria bacterium]
MVQARIYRPSKTAMQSGKAKTRNWILDFSPNDGQFIDPIMGWCGSKDTLSQIRLTFRSLEQAVAYARLQGLTFQIESANAPLKPPKQYADNFRYDRVG